MRVQKNKNHRRILFLILFITVATIAGWQAEKRYQVINYINKVILTAKKTSPADGISRGTIYDRNLKQIAVTMARVSVYARIKEIKSISETVTELAVILPQIDMENLQRKMETGSLRVWVEPDISQEEEDAIKKKNLPGIYLQREQARFYPNDTYAAHLIGYIDDNIGLAGVEFYYDRLLAKKEVEEESKSSRSNYSQDLVLTVDLKIQKILEDLVADIGSSQSITKVAAYVMDGAAGEMVGAAQFPGFNPNSFTRYSPDILENISLKQIVIPDRFRLLLRDAANVYGAIESGQVVLPWSVQVCRTDLGSQLRLWDWLGLTEPWSTDFSAYYDTDKNRETAYRPFRDPPGQSYGLVPEYASPLQILTAMAGIFGNGNKIRPHAVAAISDKVSEQGFKLVEYEVETGEFTDVIKKGAKEMEWMLRSQSSSVSSEVLFFRDENIVTAPSPGGRRFLSHEMLFALIPADTSSLKMLVLVERAQKFPLSRRNLKKRSLEKRIGQIVDRISVLQQVGKSVSDVVEAEISDEGNYPLKKQGDTLEPVTSSVVEKGKKGIGIMPDLRGLSLRRSFQLLQNHNVKIRFQGTGRVVSQKPATGASLQGLTECVLILEKAEDMKVEKMIKTSP